MASAKTLKSSSTKTWHCGLVHACFTIDGIVRNKKSENSKPLKVFDMKNLCELFPDFNFDVDEGLFHDAFQDAETRTGN